MAYAVLADILTEIDSAVLVELTDDPENPIGEINEDAVSTAIARADGIIDGYIGARISLPLSYPTPLITELSVDIAIYTIFTRRETLPKMRADRYANAMKFLSDFASGKGSIGVITYDPGVSSPQLPLSWSPDQDFTTEVWDLY